MKSILKEAGLLGVFAVLGAALLVSIWLAQNFHQEFFEDFSSDQVSVVLEGVDLNEFRSFLERYEALMGYEIQTPSLNQEQLQNAYPELAGVLGALDDDYFPSSATVRSLDGEQLIADLKAEFQNLNAFLVHRAPDHFSKFLMILSIVLFALWGFSLTMVLFFSMENLANKKERHWSLMKMLGARPSQVVMPLIQPQLFRCVAGVMGAAGLAWFTNSQLNSLFGWQWQTQTYVTWGLFLALSLTLTAGLFFILFNWRYERVALG